MQKTPNDRLSLVADIGGTNTRVALADGNRLLTQTISKYANSGFDDLQSVLGRFLADQGNVSCSAACVALAGPVQDGVGVMTNLGWSIDRAGLAKTTGATTALILNDLQAQGHALAHLPPASVTPLLAGPAPAPHGARLVVGVGTGFNAAVVFDSENGVLVPPSECGHSFMPVRSADDLALCRFVQPGPGFAVIDDIVSGRGLVAIHDWLGQGNADHRPLSAAEIMAAMADGNDAHSRQTVQIFVHHLAAVLSNLALSFLPFGGLYLVGGVARSVAPYLEEFGFADSFADKDRFSDFMHRFAIHLINDDAAALLGCVSHLSAPR